MSRRVASSVVSKSENSSPPPYSTRKRACFWFSLALVPFSRGFRGRWIAASDERRAEVGRSEGLSLERRTVFPNKWLDSRSVIVVALVALLSVSGDSARFTYLAGRRLLPRARKEAVRARLEKRVESEPNSFLSKQKGALFFSE